MDHFNLPYGHISMGFILPKNMVKLPKKWIYVLSNEGQASPRFPVLGPLRFSQQILCQYVVHFAKKNGKIAQKNGYMCYLTRVRHHPGFLF